MPKKIIQKYLPHPGQITENSLIKRLGPRLQDPGLWHINRRSVSGALAVGVFCGFLPIPFQMVLAAVGAILFRVNILIAVPIVWFSNPVTIPPIFYFCYLIGTWILGTPVQTFTFELTVEWLMSELGHIWMPLILGSLVCATIGAIISFFSVRLLWRLHIIKRYQQRQSRKRQKKELEETE